MQTKFDPLKEENIALAAQLHPMHMAMNMAFNSVWRHDLAMFLRHWIASSGGGFPDQQQMSKIMESSAMMSMLFHLKGNGGFVKTMNGWYQNMEQAIDKGIKNDYQSWVWFHLQMLCEGDLSQLEAITNDPERKKHIAKIFLESMQATTETEKWWKMVGKQNVLLGLKGFATRAAIQCSCPKCSEAFKAMQNQDQMSPLEMACGMCLPELNQILAEINNVLY